ncbi:hypothetical protein [Haloarchaeobius sp. DFWS5]|uniref:hypothetical protein n=1 Tax=Haloarchaeobius sp. DFWS5 TaxID=3446114 RepID=UPI003EB763E1
MGYDPQRPADSDDRSPSARSPAPTTLEGLSRAARQDERTTLANRFWLVLTALLLVTMPAFTLFVAFAILSVTRSAVLEQLTWVEIAELYLVEFVMFSAFAYLLYRLTWYSIGRNDATMTAREREAAAEREERPK